MVAVLSCSLPPLAQGLVLGHCTLAPLRPSPHPQQSGCPVAHGSLPPTPATPKPTAFVRLLVPKRELVGEERFRESSTLHSEGSSESRRHSPLTFS